MTITIPDGYDEVTVGQYQRLWHEFDKEPDQITALRRCIEVLGNLENGTLNNAEWGSLTEAAAKVMWFLNDPNPWTMRTPLQQRAKIKGTEFGFIPDWTRLTVAEYVDLQTLCDKGMVEHLDKVMAILYRPIVKEANGMYDIETYEPDKWRTEAMQECPMTVAVSAVVFFCNIQKALVSNMQLSSTSEAKPEKTQ